MKLILPITLAIGVAVGLTIKPHIQAPSYLTVTFEDNHYQVAEPSPLVEVAKPVYAAEEPLSDVEKIITEVFGEDAPEAIIVAKCESGHNPSAVGDTNLMVYNQGELVGDSIGVFQIRTGGKDFNRAKANNMTADEFRAWMKNPVENVKYAKTIFDRQGWGPWTCKKDL